VSKKNGSTIRPRLTQVIAEREYRLTLKGRKRQKVYLRLGKPRPFPDGKDAICVYQWCSISPLDGRFLRYSRIEFGRIHRRVDGVQRPSAAPERGGRRQ
jgi:hypothetical protein